MGPVTVEIDRRLKSALSPDSLTIIDDSAQHRGHGGYKEGVETHLSIKIVSGAFVGKSRLERQRMIYALLDDLMDNPIHALVISATTLQA